ncbi:chromate efflux transporter [Devosia sp. XJ19-1]|uniref:Chromate efflux transporter n=1 Tax=Devosia ureilytica TaxID=2952754 RepID=A0A9Q4AQL7_9HYPH|nr:chromate efflux transporter [Devosia ureilytica]MCP8884275.1 chromate efflux transporter [Devosia ureilytica]MCP8887883.1 chromate efflux transporter [Devosia ureilytica]
MSDDLAPPHPTFSQALKVWAKIGFLSFGGPAGQIALMHKELVEERRWISEARFLHALNYCMLLPGPEAQQLATYVGWLLHGWRGGVAAGVLFVLPGFAVILALATGYALFQQLDWVASIFFGLKAAVLAIVIEALIRVARRALKNWVSYGLALGAFLALFAFSVPFPVVVLGAGLIGYLVARQRPDLLAGGGHKSAGAVPQMSAVIDQDVSQVDPSWRRAAAVTAIWGGLWVAPLVPVVVLWGWDSSYLDIMGFFSQMAVVTFGGAYAVLAYVASEAVGNFGWLQPGEMLDGLALAETTPGPLVLVLSFVGYLAGFRDPSGVPPLWGGVLGAALATWVTFVPCFLWIFLGAPYIERLRSNRALAGALGAITAAVVGVIFNLALWFALHVLFGEVGRLGRGPLNLPLPAWSTLDLLAVLLTLLAAFSLFFMKWGVLRTLGLCAAAGLLLQTLV